MMGAMKEKPPLVRCHALGKHYGLGAPALADISLDAREGEFISLIGPSGCGKTTFLRLLAGLNQASAGELLVEGRPPEEKRGEMAYIFQEPALLPWLPVEGNIELPLRLRGAPKKQRRREARRLMALVGLSEAAAYYPRQLSGGMKMRVSIARALSLSPRILLMDEPFGALDAITRNRLNEELLAIRQEKAWTAFFVTHSVTEAAFLSTRIIVMTPRPGHVHETVDVPFAYPRRAELRETEAFQNLTARVFHHLRETGAQRETA